VEEKNLYNIVQLDSNGLTACDLFCGAGIGAYGIKRAGYEIIFGVDNDKDAVRTYNVNIGNHAICEDIRNIHGQDIPKHDLMIATPVCKPFSVCGARRLTNDEKYGDLLAETLRLFSECRPKALFFENVAGIAMGDSLIVFNDFVEQIEKLGYYTYWSIINSWYLGVPQERERVYLVAIRGDIPYTIDMPVENISERRTQRYAFYDLKDKTDKDIRNHNVARLNDKLFSKFSANFRQNCWDEPSKTVLSAIQSALLYPEPYLGNIDYTKLHSMRSDKDFPRRLSVREHLRLQTVGDDFYFPDDVSIIEQYNRCSGVPSLIAYKYGIAIADCLLGKTNLAKRRFKSKRLF